MNEEYIYILLSQSGTRVSRLIRFFTKKPYNHASVAADITLGAFYSFCRTDPHRPLPATFHEEIIGEGTFGLFLTIPCEIYALPVSPECRAAFLRNLEHFQTCQQQYSYNLLGLLTTFLHIPWERSNKMHCAEFVARILNASGISLEKPPCLHIPDDFRYLPGAVLVYRGDLNALLKTKEFLALF